MVWLDERIGKMDDKIYQAFTAKEPCQRLAAIEGVGPMIATAFYAAVPQAHLFHNGRHVAAWLGLVPRQHATSQANIWLQEMIHQGYHSPVTDLAPLLKRE